MTGKGSEAAPIPRSPGTVGINTRRPAHLRAAFDWYVEPSWSVEALFDVERFVGSVYDPACGEGTILDVADWRGHNVAGSDIVDRGAKTGVFNVHDFLTGPNLWGTGPDNIITNPPFALAQPFVEKALTIARFKVAALLPIQWLESKKRLAFFRSTPLARVWVSVERISMPPGGRAIEAKGGTKCFAWYVWSHDHQGPATIGHMEKPK